MRVAPLHSWKLTPKEAVQCQRLWATRVDRSTPFPVHDGLCIAAADVSYNRYSPWLHAAMVVLRMPDLSMEDQATVTVNVRFPYIPGLLSFRETPPLLSAWKKLKQKPDVLMVDGHGYAHPRRLGVACHLGLWLDLPTFGCAKSLLIGEHEGLPGRAGSQVPLLDPKQHECVGMVVRTRANVKPMYVSVGHRMDLPSAVAWTLATCRGLRQPEPSRLAHLAANRQRREHEPS